MGCKGGRVSNIPKVVKMCSITNTAHPTRRHACLGVGVGVCVVSSDALRSSVLADLRQRGAVIRERKVLDFYYGGVTRRHSFGECVLKKKPHQATRFFS